jgi:Rod binding domain-containing protein
VSSSPLTFPSGGLPTGGNALTAPITPDRRLAPVDKRKVDPKMREAAEGMEAMFLDFMMKSMRDTVQKSDMDLENAGTKLYRSMLDTETAKRAAHQGGIGLADQLIAYMESQRYNLPRHPTDDRAAAPEPRTGGTHAGQPEQQ